MSSTRFRDRPPRQQALLSVVIALAVAFVLATQRDIQRRPADQIRGSKLLWRALSLNALGAIVYRRGGRRPDTTPA
jgi:drug/metabolite transporter (DMT)-like permease